MENIYLMTWDWWTKTPTKFQGEGRMMRKRLIPKSDRVTLICVCEVAGKFQTWLRATSPSEHHLKEFEDSLPMVLTTCWWVSRSAIKFTGDVLATTMGFVQGRRSRYDLSMRGDPLSRSETINNATWVFDFESGHLDDETRRSQLGLRTWRTRNWRVELV